MSANRDARAVRWRVRWFSEFWILVELLPDLKITRPEDPPEQGAVRPQSVALSIERAREELGYEPEYPLERGIGEYVEWLQRGAPVAASEFTNGGSHD